MTKASKLCIRPIIVFTIVILSAFIVSAFDTEQPSVITGTDSSNANPQTRSTSNDDVVTDPNQKQLGNEASKDEDYLLGNDEMLENDPIFQRCAEQYSIGYCRYLKDKMPQRFYENSPNSGGVFNDGDYAPVIRNSPEKRRLRFVKRRLRFVKKDADVEENQEGHLNEKRRLRFIKKSQEETEKTFSPEKRRLRFVKKSNGTHNEKRRLRFIKKSDQSDDYSLEKRRLRFVKKDNNGGDIYSHDESQDGYAEDTSPEKRRLRFVKRNSQYEYGTNDNSFGRNHDNGLTLSDISKEKGSHYTPLSGVGSSTKGNNAPITEILKSTNDDESSSGAYNPHNIQRRSTPLAASVLASYLNNSPLEPVQPKRTNAVALQRSLIGAELYAEAQRLLRQRLLLAGKKRASPVLKTTNSPSEDVMASRILTALLKSYIVSHIGKESLYANV